MGGLIALMLVLSGILCFMTILSDDLLAKAKPIRLLAMDVDGVLTRSEIVYTSSGEELKCFNVKDGYGLRRVGKAGIQLAIITGRRSPITQKRAEELKFDFIYQAVPDKLAVLNELLQQTGLSAHEVAYMGDDIPDLPVLRQVGLATAPADAVSVVRKASHWVSQANGGYGAMRELAELILTAQGQPMTEPMVIHVD